MTAPGELHRPVAVDRLGTATLEVSIEASEAERQTLAVRMAVPGVEALTCHWRLSAGLQGVVLAEGHLRAQVLQVCVVTLDTFETSVEERFRVRFVPAGTESEDDDPDADDEIGYAGSSIDLGEATAEQLALALDPYPRKPGAALPESEEATAPGAFAALARLQRPG